MLRCKLAAIPTYLAPAASCTQEAAAARRGTVGTVQSVPTVRVHSLTVRVHSLPAAPTCFAASTKTARLFCAPCYGMCSVPHMADVQKSCAEKHDTLVHIMSAPQQPSFAECAPHIRRHKRLGVSRRAEDGSSRRHHAYSLKSGNLQPLPSRLCNMMYVYIHADFLHANSLSRTASSSAASACQCH